MKTASWANVIGSKGVAPWIQQLYFKTWRRFKKIRRQPIFYASDDSDFLICLERSPGTETGPASASASVTTTTMTTMMLTAATTTMTTMMLTVATTTMTVWRHNDFNDFIFSQLSQQRNGLKQDLLNGFIPPNNWHLEKNLSFWAET